MTGDNSAIDRFLEAWIQQFGRTIEIFNGEQPAITWSRIKELPPGESNDILWWKQAFEGASRFAVWIGAYESTWIALGGASEQTDASDAKATYLEILSKAQEATAAVMSAGLPRVLRCHKGQMDNGPDSAQVLYALIGMKFSSAELPALIMAVEPTIAQALTRGSNSDGLHSMQSIAKSPIAPMLDRLMDLELPLSVALGRTEMPIRDVLKVTSGSLIELDQNVGDYVDLVVHGTVVARGEVVSVKGNYGIRIKEVISRKDRIDLYDRKDAGVMKR